MGNSHVDVSASEIRVEMGRTQSGPFDKMLLLIIANFLQMLLFVCQTSTTGDVILAIRVSLAFCNSLARNSGTIFVTSMNILLNLF